MLCLNCIHARDEVPEIVEVEVEVEGVMRKVNIANELKRLQEVSREIGYTVAIYCEKMKVIKVGVPPSPAATVTECGEFAEA